MMNSDADPKHLFIARSLLGTKEIAGAKDNSVVMAMYADVGHSWVEHDEVPWCAAFVGACLERSGVRSTRSLAARSYLEWGQDVAPSAARPGDVVVFSRGKNPAEGHVAFFLRFVGQQIEVLGGNQSDAVTVAKYPRARLIGFRRAPGARQTGTYQRPETPAAPSAGLLKIGSQGTAVEILQRRLDDLGYQVGYIDGHFGSRSRAAVLAFQADNDLVTDGIAGPLTLAAIDRAQVRPVSEKRANADLAGLAKESRIVDASLKNMGAGGVLGVGWTAYAVASKASETVAEVDQMLVPIRGFVAEHGTALAVVAAAIGVYIAWQAWRAGQARVDDERRGKTS